MNKDTENMTNPKENDDLLNFFEEFLKPGVVIKEKEVVDGFKIKLKVLNSEELLQAESILLNSNSTIPVDILHKVRAASILSQSILQLNGIVIDKEEAPKEEARLRRHELYKQILKMPAILVQKTYEFYIEAVNEQNSFYENGKESIEKIENF